MRDPSGNWLLVALLVLPVLAAVLFGRLGKRPRSVLLASLAGRWSGRVVKGRFLGADRLEIRIAGVAGEVTFTEQWTRLHFNRPSDRRLRVVPEGLASHLRRLLGGVDIRLDNPLFDDRFWIESSHPTWARELLDPRLRRALIGLVDPTLDIGPEGIVLRVTRLLVGDAADLGSFVEAGILILQKAEGLLDAAGVALDPVRSRSGSACPVCGHPVADAALPCPSCRTPHHRECWKYFGGCAIFGCRTKFRA